MATRSRHAGLARRVAAALGWREDANETAVLTRALDYVQAEVYRVEYADLKAEQFIPVKTDVPKGAKHWYYRVWDKVGVAKIINDYANDFEKVDVFAREVPQGIVDVGDYYEYSIRDLEHAAFSNTPLDSELGIAVRDAIELAFDNIAALGDAATGLPGFLNHENVPLVTLPNGDWEDAGTTSEEILEDMRYLASRPYVNTSEKHPADTMLLDTESYELVAGRAVGLNLTDTILSVFLKTNPHIKNVDTWTKLNTASASGGRRIMCYKRDPRCVQLQIPERFRQLPTQEQGAVYKNYCLGRIGGTSWRHPMAAAYADNVVES